MIETKKNKWALNDLFYDRTALERSSTPEKRKEKGNEYINTPSKQPTYRLLSHLWPSMWLQALL